MTVSARWRRAATILAIPAALIVLAGIALVVVIAISLQDRDGDDIALDRVEHVAGALSDALRNARGLTDAATVAAEMFHSRSATVEPLTWTGVFGEGDGITIEARVSAAVEASSGGSMFARYTSAGAAERCYRYTVVALREVQYEEIPCAGLPEPSAPPVATRPELPNDAAERVERALAAPERAPLRDTLRAEFPGDEFTIDTVETPAGETVAAVGVTPGTHCILRVRLRNGEIISPPYDRTWLQPGELGCSTGLYVAPPQ